MEKDHVYGEPDPDRFKKLRDLTPTHRGGRLGSAERSQGPHGRGGRGTFSAQHQQSQHLPPPQNREPMKTSLFNMPRPRARASLIQQMDGPVVAPVTGPSPVMAPMTGPSPVMAPMTDDFQNEDRENERAARDENEQGAMMGLETDELAYLSDEEQEILPECPCCRGDLHHCTNCKAICHCYVPSEAEDGWMDAWFPDTRGCPCCAGYIYKCKEQQVDCRTGVCICYQKFVKKFAAESAARDQGQGGSPAKPQVSPAKSEEREERSSSRGQGQGGFPAKPQASPAKSEERVERSSSRVQGQGGFPAKPHSSSAKSGAREERRSEEEPCEVTKRSESKKKEKRAKPEKERQKVKAAPSAVIAPSSSFSGQAVSDWSVEVVKAWVRSLGAGFAKHIEVFGENGVDGEILLSLDKRDLEGMGLLPVQATVVMQKIKSKVSSPVSSAKSPGLYDEVEGAPEKLDLTKLVIDKNKKLGAGNFGEVFAGRIGSREVAVKLINHLPPSPGDTNKDQDNKLEKEIATWTKLPPHQNVAQLLGVVNKDGCKCIVMHFYLGGSLKEELDKSRSQGLAWRKRKCLSTLLGIANGLQHLHQHGIVHRDLAARNILFENRERDRAVITDFGLSRQIESGVEKKEYYKMAGTGALAIAWLPPETLLERKSSAKSDIWSFGVLVWEVITQGLTPLSNLDPMQISAQAATGKLAGTLVRALDNVEDADPDLKRLVEMCLVDPVNRPSIGDVVVVINDLFNNSGKSK